MSGRSPAGGSGRRPLSQPKHQVTPKPRRNPKEVREAALAKKLASINKNAGGEASSGGGTPRVRTTVTKTRSTPGGGDETTVVERVQSGSAAVSSPRYNRKKVMHPEDVYRENKRQPPTKPGAPCPKIKKGEYYSKEVVSLWEQWQQWNEYKEEIKCWKQNVPYMSQKEKEERAFKKWLQKEEEAHERLFKAGKSDVMPFHMRPEPKPKKKAGPVRSPPRRELPKTPEGKKRYEKKDCFGNYVRYNSVDDPNPTDLYYAQGQNPPQYVQPPLREDGTFKLPKERTEEETEAFMAYRKWEEFYFRQQAWDNDKKWAGDPRIQELFKIKTPSGGGAVADMSTPQGRAEARSAERSGRKAAAEQRKREKLAMEKKAAEANLRKMGMKKMTGAARVAMQAAAKREAAARAAEEAKQAELANRQRSFLKRGQRCATPVSGRGRIDVSRVRSRIGGMVRASRREAQQAAAAQAAAAAAAAQAAEDAANIPSPPDMPYDVYEMNLRDSAQQRRTQALCKRMTNQMVRHLNLAGQMGHLPTTIHFYDVGERPRPVRGSDVAILNYDARTPPASLFGGPSGDDENEVQGCEEAPPGWFDPDEPITPFGKTFNYMKHPSPPKSISKGRLPHHPMHPNDAMRMQYDLDEDEFWFAEQELERLDDMAYRDHCAQVQMNKPLRQRAAAMAAQTDVDLLHPSVFRSNLMQRQRDARSRQQLASNLDSVAQVVRMGALPDIRRRPVTRACHVPSPPTPPRAPTPPRYEDLLAIEAPPCAPPPPPRTPPPAFTPPRAATPPRPPASPFVMPERFAGGVNPFLERARAAIAAPSVHVPFRAEEIAAQAARTAAAAQPRKPADIFSAWDAEDFAADMRDQACVDQALEGLQLSPPTPAQDQQWQWPAYRQCEGPQYGALYHEHIRQPQLGPWHYTPPAGRRRRYFNWDDPPVANLVDLGVPEVAPRRAPRRNLHGLRPPQPNLCL